MAVQSNLKHPIIFLETEHWEEVYLKKICPADWTPRFYADEADRITFEKIRDAEVLSVFIYSDLDAGILSRFKNLKMIATRSTGWDHIDMNFCRENGIRVCHVPTYGANTVAEHAFALMLSLSRKIYQARTRTLKADFSYRGLQGFDLMGKVLGVIGTGRIGQHLIRIAGGFQMKILAHDSKPDASLADLLGFEYRSMADVLKEADILSLHCPLVPETRHLIGKDQFGQMKKGVLIINTARGGLIDTDGLIRALDEGIVGGAGLDVLEEEEAIREERELLSERHDPGKLLATLRNHVILKRENVIVTPHIAFNSREAVERILETTVENIRGYFSNASMNCV